MTHVGPILFSGPMVRALLAGTKTQTRRILKPPSEGAERCYRCDPASRTWDFYSGSGPSLRWHGSAHTRHMDGDLLYVRERFRGAAGYDRIPPKQWGNKGIWFDADGEPDPKLWSFLSGRSRPGIHLPRWASRITIEVEAVKVERLQDISEEDAAAEGIVGIRRPRYRMDGYGPMGTDQEEASQTRIGAYSKLWEAINGPKSWDANPFVTATTFKVHLKNVDALLAERMAA